MPDAVSMRGRAGCAAGAGVRGRASDGLPGLDHKRAHAERRADAGHAGGGAGQGARGRARAGRLMIYVNCGWASPGVSRGVCGVVACAGGGAEQGARGRARAGRPVTYLLLRLGDSWGVLRGVVHGSVPVLLR